jgi:hypothetical protein
MDGGDQRRLVLRFAEARLAATLRWTDLRWRVAAAFFAARERWAVVREAWLRWPPRRDA